MNETIITVFGIIGFIFVLNRIACYATRALSLRTLRELEEEYREIRNERRRCEKEDNAKTCGHLNAEYQRLLRQEVEIMTDIAVQFPEKAEYYELTIEVQSRKINKSLAW